ncbi:MAG: hypothetical protein H7Y61_05125 [Rhizobiales bacterium]|nr:hypothetical protein [Rhizobacter sp.]
MQTKFFSTFFATARTSHDAEAGSQKTTPIELDSADLKHVAGGGGPAGTWGMSEQLAVVEGPAGTW